MTDDRALVLQVSKMDNAINRLDEAIKLYVAKLTGRNLDEWNSKGLPSPTCDAGRLSKFRSAFRAVRRIQA